MRLSAVLLAVVFLASYAHAEDVALSGTVLTPYGAPAEGATVTLWFVPSEVALGFPTLTQTTGPDGAWAFDFATDAFRRSFSVFATMDGYALASGGAERGVPCELRLLPDPVAATGQVVSEGGEPIEDALVSIPLLQPPRGSDLPSQSLSGVTPSPLSDTTDAEGRFAIDGLPRGWGVQFSASGEGWASWRDQMVVTESRPVEFPALIVLQPGARISGTVTRDGAPVPDILVAAVGSNSFTHAEEDGRYTLRGLVAGEYTVLAVSPEDAVSEPVEGVEVGAGDHREGVDLELIEGGIIEGTLTIAATGEPVPGHIFFGGIGTWGITDENGHYRIHVLPGETRIRWQGEPRFPNLEGVPHDHLVEVADGETVSGVDFVLAERAGYEGTVVDAAGEPVEGARVSLVASTRAVRETATGADGRFRLQAFGWGGSYGLWAQKGDLVAVRPAGDVGEDVTLTMEPGGYCTVVARDLAGQPLAGVEFEAWSGGGRNGAGPAAAPGAEVGADGLRFVEPPFTGTAPGEWLTDADGTVRIGPLPAGPELTVQTEIGWRRRVSDEAWARGIELSVAPGEDRSLGEASFDPDGRRLVGRVVAGDGEPVSGAWVMTHDTFDGSPATARTDAEGAFALDGLLVLDVYGQAEVTVLAFAPDGATAYASPCDPDAGPVTLELEPGGGAMGRLTTPDGRPLAGAEVEVRSREYRWRHDEIPGPLSTRTITTSDADGRWRVDNLVPGLEYSVTVEAPGWRGIDSFLLTMGQMVVGVQIDLYAADERGAPPEAR